MTEPSFQTVIKMLLETIVGSVNLPLRSFDSLFPNMDPSDKYTLVLSDVSPPELSGRYSVVDLYCQDPFCHCCKVSLIILDKDQKIHATISYGWKSKTFYRKWGLDKDGIQSLTHGFLDPWAQQSEHAPLFLKAFLFTLKKDHRFIARLKHRYSLFKEAIDFDPSLIMPYPETKFPENVIPLNSYKSR